MPLKILHLHFFGGSGGKFISNCLSTSGKVAFPNYQILKEYHLTKNIDIVNQALLNTIPDKKERRLWLYKEQGCDRLFGNGIIAIRNGNLLNSCSLYNFNNFCNYWLPIVSHDHDSANHINKYFLNNNIFFVGILGNKEFIDYAIRLKWPNTEHCLDLDLYYDFLKNFKELNFNHIIDNWNPLDESTLYQIENLAMLINVQYNNFMAKEYINKYQNFHL